MERLENSFNAEKKKKLLLDKLSNLKSQDPERGVLTAVYDGLAKDIHEVSSRGDWKLAKDEINRLESRVLESIAIQNEKQSPNEKVEAKLAEPLEEDQEQLNKLGVPLDEKLKLYLDPDSLAFWYYLSDGSAKMIEPDSGADLERENQQRGDAASAGYPEFEKMHEEKAFPSAPVAAANPSPADHLRAPASREPLRSAINAATAAAGAPAGTTPRGFGLSRGMDRGSRGSRTQAEAEPAEVLSAAGGRRREWRLDARDYRGLTIKTVQQILADPDAAQFFGERLRAIDPEAGETLERYVHGTATKEDMDLLTYGAHEYAKWNAKWESVSSGISKEDLELFSRRNSDLLNIVSHVGAERGQEVLKNVMRHMAMRDPDALEELEVSLTKLRKNQNSFLGRRAERRFEKLSAKIGISRSDYETTVDLSSRESRQRSKEDLESIVKARAGKARQAIDWVHEKTGVILPGSSRHAALRFLSKAERITPDMGPTHNMMSRVNESLGVITSHLGAIVSSEDVRPLIAKETIEGKRYGLASETGPKSIAEAKEGAEKVSPAKLEEKIREHISRDPQWSTGGPDYQDSVLRDLKKKSQKEVSRGKGFWAWLVSVLFKKNFDKAASAAAGRPVHVH